jgi:hypothetical protein
MSVNSKSRNTGARSGARLVTALVALCAAACSAPQGDAPVPSPASAPSETAPAAEEPAPVEPSGSPEASNVLAAPEEPAPSEPAACSAGMVLVEGDYCTAVEHECKKEWFSEANKKRVCEEFEPTSKCTGERVPKRYCIDEYSWPNQKGERPEVMNNFYQAQVKCAAVGKRLCTESEWTMACEGPRLLPFPYGYVRDTSKCNGDREWDHPDMNKVAKRDPTELARLWQGVRSGSQPECKSEYGVWDLPGNNDEVVQSETYSSDYRGKFDSVHTGGPWYRGVRNQCRPKIYTHNEGFYYYFLGFRCCAEPDGKETNPLGPKQIKRGWEFERVERLAKFTREEMKAKLEQKKAGKCECDAKDILCKTMCGTLLGPEAKDAVLGSRSD